MKKRNLCKNKALKGQNGKERKKKDLIC